MTTVHTPRAATRTGAAAGGGRIVPGAVAEPDDLLVLPGSLRDRSAAGVGEPREVSEALPGDRLRRLKARKRLFREQLLAVLFLFAVLAVTVGVLAMQWLGSGPTSGSVAPSSVVRTLSGGHV